MNIAEIKQNIQGKINDNPKLKVIIPLSIGIVLVIIIAIIVMCTVNKKPDVTAGYDRVYTEEEIADYMEQGLVREVQPKEEVTEEPIEEIIEETVEEEISLLDYISDEDWYDGTLTCEVTEDISENTDETGEEETTEMSEYEDVPFEFIDTETYKKWIINGTCDEMLFLKEGYYEKGDNEETYVKRGLAKIIADYSEEWKQYSDMVDAYKLLHSETAEMSEDELNEALAEAGINSPTGSFDIAYLKEVMENSIPLQVEWIKTDDNETLTFMYSDGIKVLDVTFDLNGFKSLLFIDEENNTYNLKDMCIVNDEGSEYEE